MFSQNRDQLRAFYQESWRKRQAGSPLTPLEDMVAEVIAMHPEYHAMLEAGEDVLQRDYLPDTGESNPFLHMGLHLALREQVTTGRPAALPDLYRKLTGAHSDAHEAEHQMIECLAAVLWAAQSSGREPDDNAYLECLRKLLKPRKK